MNITESALQVLTELADNASLTLGEQVCLPDDPLNWKQPRDYSQLLDKSRSRSGLKCGVAWGTATVGGARVVLAANDMGFMAGAIGRSEAATLERCFQTACKKHLPVVWFARGSGVNLYEGTCSLLGMTRVLAARNALAKAGLPLITVAADPLMGGSTMCAAQADILLGLSGARIGFAGAKTVEWYVKTPLPQDFQTTQYALANGQIDAVVEADQLKPTLASLLRTLGASQKASGKQVPRAADTVASAWELVQQATADAKPSTRDVIASIAEEFFELRGDRVEGDDPALLGGMACVGGQGVLIIGYDRWRSAEDKVRHNFAMPHPSGYRKAVRLVRLAGRVGLPIVTIIDSPGACPDIKGEAQGLGRVMGEFLCELLSAEVPTVAVFTGEGNSGSAATMAACDHVIMTPASYYTVVSPEGAAAILWKDASQAPAAAEQLRLSPKDNVAFGTADAIIQPSDLREAVLAGLGMAEQRRNRVRAS